MNRNHICYFQNIWEFLSLSAVSNFNSRGKTIDSSQIYVIFIEILSQPCAFSGSKVFIINEISFWVTRKEVILELVLYANRSNELPLFIDVHNDGKRSLNKLSFVEKCATKLLLISKRETVGILLLHKDRFNFDQYVLGAVFGFSRLLITLSIQLFLVFRICSVQYAAFASDFSWSSFFFDRFYNKIWLICFFLSNNFLFYHSFTGVDNG